MVCVVADDITGAAEMAGIAHRLGLSVSLSLDWIITDDCDVAVIATDTRSMTESEAIAALRKGLSKVKDDRRIRAFFKKTDSALRGNVVAELSVMINMLDLNGALYLPANPSKGRIIKDGCYLIDGMPIDKTPFSFDPEFPAFSARLTERFPNADTCAISFQDVCTSADLDDGVESAMSKRLLLAGAADLFTSFLKKYFNPKTEKISIPYEVGKGSCIVVCGSTQSDPTRCGIKPSYMPTEVYDGIVLSDAWAATLAQRYAEPPHRVLIAVKDHHRTGREVAVHLRQTMALVVKNLVGMRSPDHLIIEGGATAFAILSALGWDSFEIQNEIAPGVISMKLRDGNTKVSMKPGSYPWGGMFAYLAEID